MREWRGGQASEWVSEEWVSIIIMFAEVRTRRSNMHVRVVRGNEADNHHWHAVWLMSVKWKDGATLLRLLLLLLRKLHSAKRCCHSHELLTRTEKLAMNPAQSLPPPTDWRVTRAAAAAAALLIETCQYILSSLLSSTWNHDYECQTTTLLAAAEWISLFVNERGVVSSRSQRERRDIVRRTRDADGRGRRWRRRSWSRTMRCCRQASHVPPHSGHVCTRSSLERRRPSCTARRWRRHKLAVDLRRQWLLGLATSWPGGCDAWRGK